MRSIGAYEAKTNFSRLLEEVANGEAITITRNGIPVAVLTPARRRTARKTRSPCSGTPGSTAH